MARSSVKELAEYILQNQRTKITKLTSAGTPGGGNEEDSTNDGLPMPIGDEGDVLTVVDDGGTLVPSWEPPVGGVTPQYRRYIMTANPTDAGFIIMDAGGGIPMYMLADLE